MEPFFATIMPPLKLPGFNTESYQCSHALLIRTYSASGTGIGAGNLIRPALSLAGNLSFDACPELHDAKSNKVTTEKQTKNLDEKGSRLAVT
jgi:hypothetical protein